MSETRLSYTKDEWTKICDYLADNGYEFLALWLGVGIKRKINENPSIYLTHGELRTVTNAAQHVVKTQS